ncbi:MAG: hypothetical protein LBS32_00110 [Clostridiales Family XIII bacterium]|jgi:nitrogenase molybdenum-iron protein beta chain|nr:hypothetical protein [Clostridiales Family XIII bacterium]
MGFVEKPRFSCMLGGALATINALPRVAPIVHASQGCGGNLYMAAFSGSGYFGSGYCGGNSAPSSSIIERDIVFGGEERLAEQIEATLELMDADLFIVLSSCMTEIIGDHVKGVTERFHKNAYGAPILAVETAGFAANSYEGYGKVFEGLFESYIDPVPQKDPRLLNIFGVIPSYDPFFRGELEEIRRILGRLGIKANTFFTNGQTVEDIRSAGAASLNLNLSSVYFAEGLERIRVSHGIPHAALEMPVGAQATERFIADVSALMDVPPETGDAVAADEARRYYAYMDRALDLYADADFQQYGIVVSNANRAIPYARYLIEEIGWIGEYVFVTDDLDEAQRDRLSAEFQKASFPAEPRLVFETGTDRIMKRFFEDRPQFVKDRYFDAFSPAFILGSSLEREFAQAINAGLLSVSFPVTNRLIMHRGYAGYNGGLALFEDIVGTLVGPR